MSDPLNEKYTFISFSFEELRDENFTQKLLKDSVLPFSHNRLRSFLNNPRARKDDILLVICKLHDQIIAYRTMLPDDLVTGLKNIHFAWLSGIWVSPAYRSRGIGKKLHELAWEAWAGQLIGTEFTPVNGQVMLQTKHYSSQYHKKGTIIYYQSPIKDVIINRYPSMKNIRFIFSGVDIVFNAWGRIRHFTAKTIRIPENCSMNLCDDLSEDAKLFILEYGAYSSTNRRLAELDWIIKYPWISGDLTAKAESEHYYFSVYANNFSLKFLEIRIKGILEGIAMISLRDGVMKIPYLFIDKEKSAIAASCILRYAIENRTRKLISYHTQLNIELIRQDQQRIYFKETSRKYLISKTFNKIGDIDILQFEDGDGDCVFV